MLSRDESVHVPDTEANADEVSRFLAKCKMAGDVNLFLSPSQDEDEDEDKEAAVAGKASAMTTAPAMDAELEVMIAGKPSFSSCPPANKLKLKSRAVGTEKGAGTRGSLAPHSLRIDIAHACARCEVIALGT